MGNFDGNSHVVSGVYVVNNGNRYAGLFGVCDGGEIHNLAVVDSYVDANGAFGGAVIAAHLLGYSGYSSGMKVYQCYAEGFYGKHGFQKISDKFMLDGILHYKMLRP